MVDIHVHKCFDGCPDSVVRGLQDRAMALLVEEHLRDRCLHSEFELLRHLMEPGTMFVVPHPLITQCGSYVSTDDTDCVNIATLRQKQWDIWHMEFMFFRQHGLMLHPVGADILDMLYYFPMAAYIRRPTDPLIHDFEVYRRRRGPIGAGQCLVRWCQEGRGASAKWGHLPAAGDEDTDASAD